MISLSVHKVFKRGLKNAVLVRENCNLSSNSPWNFCLKLEEPCFGTRATQA